MTEKQALETAKNELNRAILLSEYGRSAGIRAKNEDKAEWLSVLIYNAEQNIKRNIEKEIEEIKIKSIELRVRSHFDKAFAKMIIDDNAKPQKD